MGNEQKSGAGKFVVWAVVIVLVVLGLVSLGGKNGNDIKIGIITDLTGPAAYWGESTQAGARLAIDDLKQEGIKADLIFEDYGLDAPKAASAVQKLVSIDNIQAIYAEFNPAAISVGSFLKDKAILYVYDAAVVSPLKDLPYAYKTYLDYQAGCKAVAEKFKESGINKIGVLKVNLEFGELCLAGVKEAYGNNTVVEGYNLGDTDFRTQLLKINSHGAGAVINVGFESDTHNTLKFIHNFGYKMSYGTVDDTISEKVKLDFGNELKNGHSFGFKDVDSSFSMKLRKKLNGKKLTSEYGAAIAYTHIKQIVKALEQCNKDISCASEKLSKAQADPTIGFKGFQNHIGVIEMLIKDY